MDWRISVYEDHEHQYDYYFETWAEVLVKLNTFDGLAMEYSICHVRKGWRG